MEKKYFLTRLTAHCSLRVRPPFVLFKSLKLRRVGTIRDNNCIVTSAILHICRIVNMDHHHHHHHRQLIENFSFFCLTNICSISRTSMASGGGGGGGNDGYQKFQVANLPFMRIHWCHCSRWIAFSMMSCCIGRSDTHGNYEPAYWMGERRSYRHIASSSTLNFLLFSHNFHFLFLSRSDFGSDCDCGCGWMRATTHMAWHGILAIL